MFRKLEGMEEPHPHPEPLRPNEKGEEIPGETERQIKEKAKELRAEATELHRLLEEIHQLEQEIGLVPEPEQLKRKKQILKTRQIFEKAKKEAGEVLRHDLRNNFFTSGIITLAYSFIKGLGPLQFIWWWTGFSAAPYVTPLVIGIISILFGTSFATYASTMAPAFVSMKLKEWKLGVTKEEKEELY